MRKENATLAALQPAARGSLLLSLLGVLPPMGPIACEPVFLVLFSSLGVLPLAGPIACKPVFLFLTDHLSATATAWRNYPAKDDVAPPARNDVAPPARNAVAGCFLHSLAYQQVRPSRL